MIQISLKSQSDLYLSTDILSADITSDAAIVEVSLYRETILIFEAKLALHDGAVDFYFRPIITQNMENEGIRFASFTLSATPLDNPQQSASVQMNVLYRSESSAISNRTFDIKGSFLTDFTAKQIPPIAYDNIAFYHEGPENFQLIAYYRDTPHLQHLVDNIDVEGSGIYDFKLDSSEYVHIEDGKIIYPYRLQAVAGDRTFDWWIRPDLTMSAAIIFINSFMTSEAFYSFGAAEIEHERTFRIASVKGVRLAYGREYARKVEIISHPLDFETAEASVSIVLFGLIRVLFKRGYMLHDLPVVVEKFNNKYSYESEEMVTFSLTAQYKVNESALDDSAFNDNYRIFSDNFNKCFS